MAGEIQLNSTTMATESSGSITAQLDTIRPNTTNGSLTLQGDSSDAGVTGLTIDSSGNATFAQTISGGTIGSSVVFPAGHIIQTVTTIETGLTGGEHNLTGSVGPSDTGISASIACSSGSKLLITVSLTNQMNDTQYFAYYKIYKGGTELLTSEGDWLFYTLPNSSIQHRAHFTIIDTSPNTSVTSYQLYVEQSNSSGYVRTYADSDRPAYMILQEIAG